MKIFIYSTYPVLLQPPPYPSMPLLIVSWKIKNKNTGIDITCFFYDAKSALTKHKKYLLEASCRTSEISELEPFTKKINGL